MDGGNDERVVWPALPLEGWQDTYATLHMWTQVVGKICLALTPKTNHFWNIAFSVGPRGFSTPLLSCGDQSFSIAFDFLDHHLKIVCCDGTTDQFPLEPRTVADFYRELMTRLRGLGLDVHIWPMPVEVPEPIRFDLDEVHRSYDGAAAQTFWRCLVAMKPVFEKFRAEFLGKSSPVHFFWGSFDLAVTRFSGRRAPERPGADSITREAYSHEVISHGFWPGGGTVREPVFYAYAAPEPAGFAEAAVSPAEAYYSQDFHEFFLPYEAVRTSPSPEATLISFFASTYEAGAGLAGWNRSELERS